MKVSKVPLRLQSQPEGGFTVVLETFRQAADRTLGPAGLPWSVSYCVRVGMM
jgi:hypothetical protein